MHHSQSGPEPARPVHIVFVGAGAVGCFYASRLHHPERNIHVSLIARSNYSVLAKDGVKLQTHTFGDYVFTPHSVFPSVPAAATAQQWDYVIVTTKALPDRSDDSKLIAPLVSDRTCIVLIQNGVGVEEPYRTRFPNTPIVSAVTVISAEQIQNGVIRQNRWTRIHLGPYTDSASTTTPPTGVEPSPGQNTTATRSLIPVGGTSSTGQNGGDYLHQRGLECAQNLQQRWTLGGIKDVEVSDEIHLQLIRWHKLCINAAFNPSAVLSGGRGNADMVRDPELRKHLKGVMEEIWDATPKILGRKFPDHLAQPEKILKSTERNVGSKPSMLLDWETGRAMELEVILGNPVRIARNKGVELPRMESMYALLKSAQATREEREEKLKKGKGRL
ncbi:ketopantoate reductase PanE/ApbA-domain-containing protein [Diplogelasinospora grovesii]|uniref:Ketopantoate reductase PanE/ApbA-domain-containing protein n=1 Tax=Diplogelasinospora grovesii TaxID=303347 RepID=A0AAN6NIZ2_9PEZI|nr:ketopantoate reductase PanE/ApbA-domain-containing protein [Diplogelasinospora grovesii]